MRFISRLFNRVPGEMTGSRSRLRYARFEADAKNFFQSVVRSIDECPRRRGEVTVFALYTDSWSNAEIAIKAYELSALSGLLDVMEYVPRAQGRDFCDLLFGQVCGSALSASSAVCILRIV